jgi:hypothetical protein
MNNLGVIFLGGAIAVDFFLVLHGQPGLAQQPSSYVDISSSDFEKIDGIVRKILEPLKEGKIDEFEKRLTKHSAPDMEELGDFKDLLKEDNETVGKTRDIRYVRHESVKNVTDYYVFYYADMRESELFPWSFTFYKVKGEWKIIRYRFDVQSPVEFFKFGELQYDSFSR